MSRISDAALHATSLISDCDCVFLYIVCRKQDKNFNSILIKSFALIQSYLILSSACLCVFFFNRMLFIFFAFD